MNNNNPSALPDNLKPKKATKLTSANDAEINRKLAEKQTEDIIKRATGIPDNIPGSFDNSKVTAKVTAESQPAKPTETAKPAPQTAANTTVQTQTSTVSQPSTANNQQTATSTPSSTATTQINEPTTDDRFLASMSETLNQKLQTEVPANLQQLTMQLANMPAHVISLATYLRALSPEEYQAVINIAKAPDNIFELIKDFDQLRADEELEAAAQANGIN